MTSSHFFVILPKHSYKSMRQSALFTKTVKETPKDEVSKNAQLLLRAGFIYKEMAGVYGFLPLGLRVFKKIENIIREEMDALGAQEIVLPSLQNKETWEPTDQWDDAKVEIWFKTKLKNETILGLAFTHEAAMTKLMLSYANSYRDLPKYLYQFQTKFRNEVRAKSGIMRSREFVMKDMYSFSRNEEEHATFYEKAKQAYIKVFDRLGLGDITYLTFASGGVFAKFSHEFQTLTEAGEDTIFVSREKKIAINKEVYTPEILAELGVDASELSEEKAAEVGNIFNLATRFSSALGLTFSDETGEKHPVIMGSYGIGPARLMGTITEVMSDERGIVWPEAIAPFKVHLLALKSADPAVKEEAEKLYASLTTAGVEVLFDDRAEASSGQKFADADLIGCPYRLVISDKSLAAGGAELKKRSSAEARIIPLNEISPESFS